jgi:hypothetical protein
MACGGAMTGWGVCAGTLSRCKLSGPVLVGLVALKAGDCTSCLMPLATAGESRVRMGALGGAPLGAPFSAVNGLPAVGVAAFPVESGRDDRLSPMLSKTCRCWRSSASLSTRTPGVAELRPTGVLGSDTGLCLSLSFNCCLGAGLGAAPDMLSLSFGCGGSSTLALASASFAPKISCIR